MESIGSSEPTPEGYFVINTRDVSTQISREEQLKRQNRRLDKFASPVSLDMKNPFNVATGRLELAM